MARARHIAALLAVAAVAAACGGGSHPPAPHPAPELLWVKRVTATVDPVADDLLIRADGRAVYRKGLGGKGRGIATERIPAARVERLRHLLADARLTRLPEPNGRATPGGFYYTVRYRGRSAAFASGHVPSPARPLVHALDRLILHLDDRMRFPLM